jgi:hypothetical protein
MNVTKAELFDMIMELRKCVDLLMGKPRGEISMTEYRIACERRDKATMRRYLDQEEQQPIRKNVLSGPPEPR